MYKINIIFKVNMYNASNSGVTQLEFNQAMNDFKHMFPEMEEDVIEAVLRSNNGVVDSTIDQLLQMNTESQKKNASVTKSNVSMLSLTVLTINNWFCSIELQ